MITLFIKVTKIYDIVQGEYLGTPYQYMDAVGEVAQTEDAPTRASRIVFRIKGNNLDHFLNDKDILMDGLPHEFSLLFDAKEITYKDGSVHPQNTMPILVDYKI